jgi:hypothetical protein
MILYFKVKSDNKLFLLLIYKPSITKHKKVQIKVKNNEAVSSSGTASFFLLFVLCG